MSSKAYFAGYYAYTEGKGINEVPYEHNPEKDDWEVGWLTANNEDLQAEYHNYDWKQMV